MTLQHTQVRWKKSSDGQDTCVEIAHTLAMVRDSKNPIGPTLAVDARQLITAIKDGQLGR